MARPPNKRKINAIIRRVMRGEKPLQILKALNIPPKSGDGRQKIHYYWKKYKNSYPQK